jgi:dsDNA-binding SOS-regulon protein
MENEGEVPTEVTEVPETAQEPTQETPVSESSPENQPEAAKPVEDELIPRKRLDKVVWQREELRRENEHLRQLAQQPKEPPQATVDQSKPVPGQYQDWETYTAALAEWSVTSTLKKAQDEHRIRSEKERFISTKRAFDERAAQVRSKHPDYDELFESAPISEAMAPTILESEQGPELAMYLAKNPDVARKIYHLSPTQAARELGKIEAKLDGLMKPVTVTNATPPLSPAKPKGAIPDGLDDSLPMDVWMKRRNKQLGR